jgi:hypothetical protein
MGVAIFPHSGSSFGSRVRFESPAAAPPQFAGPRVNLSPRERAAAQVPGRLARRLTNLGVYIAGVLISASIGPLIYAVGDRENAVRWAFDALDLLNKF